MTIYDFMNENAKPNMIYHVGSKSGFLFVGTKDEFLRDVDKLTEDYLKSIKKRLDEYIRFCEKNPDSVVTYSYKERIPLLQEEIETFTDLKTREIIEVYPRISTYGLVIIVDGKETGKYWDRGEYLAAKKGR